MTRRSGTTLIEMLVSIGMLALVLSLSGMAFAELTQLRGAQERYTQRRDAALHLLREIALAVRESHGFVAEMDGIKSGRHALLLRTAEGELMYRSEPGCVRRVAVGPSGKQEAIVMKAEGVQVHFAVEGAVVESARSAVTTAEWTEPLGLGISKPMLSLRASRRAGR